MRNKGSDLLVAALENEGVERIFGLPGEENLAVVESLRHSKIELVLTRHEQAASFMAATQGRLTGSPGVCLSTLGPGALNFTTGAAYAYLGAMPMIMITGQKAIKTRAAGALPDRRHRRRDAADHQADAADHLGRCDPLDGARRLPRRDRGAPRSRASGIARGYRLGGSRRAALIPPHPIDRPVASPAAIRRVADMILAAKRPLVMIGAAGNRPRLVDALSDFVRRAQIPFFNTQMGKGAVTGVSELYLGTAALSERDYVHGAIERADLIIAIGHDTVEKPPFLMGDGSGPKVAYIGYGSATVEQVFHPDAEAIGDIGATRHRACRDAWRAAAAGAGIPGAARRDFRSHQRARRGRPLSGHPAAAGARRAQGDAGGRHRLPRQRHVQDLVRAQLPHHGRQHAAARQRAGDHGRRPALGDRGEVPQSATSACSRSAATAAS